uniref:Movement protein n=1 Tax=Apple necrotic mosaic virus TaxID=1779339 RepID=A0A7D4ZSR2_9BROM|nr:movement protein [Apple necrotic mosaic virus]
MAVADSKSSSDFIVEGVSMSEYERISGDLHQLMISKEMCDLPTKGCHILHLQNLPKSKVLELESREQRGVLSKVADRIREKVYRDTGRIFFVYVPVIQGTSSGTITLKLQNTDTGEVSDVVTDAPAERAFVIMDRWGRSLTSKAKLVLLYSICCPNIRPEARVGDMCVFWDEHMSKQMTYVKKPNPIMFPIEETYPAQYLKDKKMLMSMIRGRIALGAEGADIRPDVLKVESASSGRKLITIEPKDSPKPPKIEEMGGTSETDVHVEETDRAVRADPINA